MSIDFMHLAADLLLGHLPLLDLPSRPCCLGLYILHPGATPLSAEGLYMTDFSMCSFRRRPQPLM